MDTAAPTRSSATVDRNQLVLTYNENLDTGSVPAASSFALNTGQPSVSSVAISGKTATLTLASNVADDATVTLSYTAPATNKLQDAAGNPAANFSAISVTNSTDTVVPTVTFTPAASATVSGKAKLTLTFSEPVYSDNTGTAFTDTTAAGVVTLKAGSSNAADIAFTASMETTGTDANKVISISPVDGSDNVIDLASGNVYLAISNGFYDATGNQGAAANVTFTVDATAPAVSTTTNPSVAGKALTITFDEALDTSKVPDKSAFSVTATGSPTVTAVAVSGSTVTLTLSKPVVASTDDDDQVTVDYTAPNSNALQDAVGNKVASFTGEEVDNDTDTTAPTVTVSPADGTVSNASTVTLTFSEAVYSDTANTAFDATSAAALVTMEDSSGTAINFTAAVTTSGTNANKVITLTPSTWSDGEVDVDVAATYYDADGNAGTSSEVSFEVDRTAPTVSSAKIGGDILLVTMSETLDSDSVPAGSRFTLTVSGGGTAPTVSSITVSTNTVRLKLSAAVTSAQTVTLAYSAPDTNPLKDPAGNLLADISSQAVTNNTGVGPTAAFVPEDGKAYTSNSTGVVITFSTLVYSDKSLTAFTTATAAGIVTLKENNSSGDSITFSVSSVGTDSSKTKTTFTLTTNEGGTGLFADGTKFVSVSNAYYNDTGNQGTAANATFDIDTAAPSVTAAQSGFFGEAATTNAVAGVLKPGDDVYMRVVFNEVMRQVTGTGSSRQPALRYWTKAPSDTNYTYGNFKNVASSATLNDGECKPMAAITNYPAGTRFVCRYTVPTGNDGDFGYSASTDSKDRAGNALAATFTSTKKLTRDGVAPTVSSAAYYSDANASTSLSGTVKGGSDVYTKVTFSENVGHTAGNGASARPEINYKVGSGSDVQYHIVASTATLASGDCQPTSAAPAKVYLCRYAVGGSDSGTLGFEVDTGTTDEPGNALAAAWTPANTLTLEPAPVFSTTIADQRFEVDKAIATLTLPAATGGDAGTTITYTLSPALPTGLTFSATNRTITGTPTTESGAVEYTYTATETDGDSASLKFKITPYIVFDLIVPSTVNITEGGTVTITAKLTTHSLGNIIAELHADTTLDSDLLELTSGEERQTLNSDNWNTGVTWTLTAKEDSDETLDTDIIDIDAQYPDKVTPIVEKSITVRIKDNDDTSIPTVTSGSTGFFSDSSANTALSGTVPLGKDVYSKVTFSEDMDHVASTGSSARPEIEYKAGSASATVKQYAIVANSATLATGQCKPNHATQTRVYICRYTIGSSDDGTMDLRVGTNSEDKGGNAIASAYTHSATLTVDATAPTVTAYAVDQSTLTLTFSETMDSGKAATSAFDVQVAGSARSVSSYTLSGTAATMTLASAVSQTDSVTFAYTAPGSGTVLADAAGNPLANITATNVPNGTDTTAPSVTFKLGTSTLASTGFFEGASDNIVLEFNEPVYSDNAQTAFTTSSAESLVTLKKGGSSGDDLDFSAAVTTSGTNKDKVITINPSSDLPEGKVYLAISSSYYDAKALQGSASNITFTVDAKAPALTSVTADGASLKAYFGENLNESVKPPNTQFSATINGSAASFGSFYQIEDNEIELNILPAAKEGDSITFSYTKPASGGIEDLNGRKWESVSSYSVTNLTDETKPTVTISPANGTRTNVVSGNITLTFSEPIVASAIGTRINFTNTTAKQLVTLRVGTKTGTVIPHSARITTTGSNTHKEIVIDPTNNLAEGAVYVGVGTNSGGIRNFYDRSHNRGDDAHIIFTVDTTAPTLSSAKINRTTLTATFSENLASEKAADSDFEIKVGTNTASIGSYSISGTTLTFTLSSEVAESDAVTIKYTKPSGANDKKIKDLAGNTLENVAVTTVTNETVDRTVKAASTLTVTEGSTSDLKVELATQPTASVTVTLTSSNSAVTVDTNPNQSGNQNTLTFTTSNWDDEQTVKVAAAHDDGRRRRNRHADLDPRGRGLRQPGPPRRWRSR